MDLSRIRLRSTSLSRYTFNVAPRNEWKRYDYNHRLLLNIAVIASDRRSPIPIPEGQGTWQSHVRHHITRTEITTSLTLLVMTSVATFELHKFINTPETSGHNPDEHGETYAPGTTSPHLRRLAAHVDMCQPRVLLAQTFTDPWFCARRSCAPAKRLGIAPTSTGSHKY